MRIECIVQNCHAENVKNSVFCPYHDELVNWRENHKNNFRFQTR